MSLLAQVLMTLLAAHFGCSQVEQPQIPDSFKDVFIPGLGGKKTLGSMASTCWARGGICVKVRSCPSLRIDIAIAGCDINHKVCCKVHRLLSPTVGILRRDNVPNVKQLEDLGSTLQIIALGNSLLLSHDVLEEHKRE